MINLYDLLLVNYCHPNCTPLQNIIWLPEEEAFDLAYRFAKENPDTTAFGRFADFTNYYPRRLETDRLLHQDFIRQGGKPEVDHPLSFVLQGSEYLHGWFSHGIITRIPLSDIPAAVISFTLGDSMSAPRPDGTVHVLTKQELMRRVSEYPGTLEGFMQEINKTCHYIEAQVWRKLSAG